MKVKLDFKKLEREINYLSMWPSYIDGNGELVNFEETDENGDTNVDNWPMSINEFIKKGYKYGGSIYNCESGYGTDDDVEPTFDYCFKPEFNSIEIIGKTFTMKECLIIINMVMKQLEDPKHSYCVCYGFDGDEGYQYFHQDPSHFGRWWVDFLRFFEGRIDDIKFVNITLDIHKEEFNDKVYDQPVMHITLFNKIPYGEDNEVAQYKKDDGDLYVTLEKDGEEKEFKVCNLVWENFKGEIPEGFKVSHIDGDKENNKLENLKLEKINANRGNLN